jgi:hypothetical protein
MFALQYKSGENYANVLVKNRNNGGAFSNAIGKND